MNPIGTAIVPAEHSEQCSRKSQVRSQRVLDLLSVETSDEGRDNGAIQQSLEFAASIVRSRQVKFCFQHWLHELADPLWGYGFQLRGYDAAGSSSQSFAGRENRLIGSGNALQRSARGIRPD